MSRELEYHFCERDEGWAEYDNRGIYLTFVCDVCVEAKLTKYRKDVLCNALNAVKYWADEPIEEEL